MRLSFAARLHPTLSLNRLLFEKALHHFATLRSPSPAESVARILQSEFGSPDGSSPALTTCKQKAPERGADSVSTDSCRPQSEHQQQHDSPQCETDSPVLDPKHGQYSPYFQTRECKQNDPRDMDRAFNHGNADSHSSGLVSPPSPRDGSDTACICENANSGRCAHDSHPSKALKQPAFCIKTSQDIIKLLIERVNAQSWIALNKDIEEHSIEIRPKEVAWVLKVLKDPNRARDLFIWAVQRPGYAHDATCYAIMIDLLGDNPDHVFLNNLLAEIEKKHIQLNVSTISRLIGIFASGDEIDRAEHYFLKLQNLGLQPNAFTYKCMLQAFAKAGKCKKAFDMYRAMQREGQPIDLITFNMLLDGLSRNGQVVLAQSEYFMCWYLPT
ncbi:hypothetical protein L7F22_005136 [Adiantum nelumboides]|nr:hypothetical protein [Adiantum nelumboides]